MYTFGVKSLNILDTTSKYLQLCAKRTIKESKIDISIPEWGGLRDAEYQFKLYKKGWSKADGTNIKSNHQKMDAKGKSLALDLCAYHKGKQSWNGERLVYIAGLMLKNFKELKELKVVPDDLHLHWGGFWQPRKGNEEGLGFDLPHFEIRTLPQTKIFV